MGYQYTRPKIFPNIHKIERDVAYFIPKINLLILLISRIFSKST